MPPRRKPNIGPGLVAVAGDIAAGGGVPAAPAAPSSPSGGGGNSWDEPIPTGSASSDAAPILDPTGRWVLNTETGRWEPYQGSPIGVGPDFVQVRPPELTQETPGGELVHPMGVGAVASLPAFFDGDEFSIGAGLSPETIAGMQQSLQDAGIISPTAVLPYGVWDATTANAMKQVLAVANQQGVTWEAAFESTVTNAISLTGGGYLDDEGNLITAPEAAAKPTPLTLPQGYIMNPDDLAAIFQAVGQRTIGRKLSEQDVNKFVGDFQTWQSTQFYDKHWDAESGQWISDSPGSLPSPETAAEKQILGDYGDEAGAEQLAATFDQFESILSGPFGSA